MQRIERQVRRAFTRHRNRQPQGWRAGARARHGPHCALVSRPAAAWLAIWLSLWGRLPSRDNLTRRRARACPSLNLLRMGTMAWPWHWLRPFVGRGASLPASSPSRSQGGSGRCVDPRATRGYGARAARSATPLVRDGRSRKGPDDMTDTNVGRRELTVGLAALGAAAWAPPGCTGRAERFGNRERP